VNFSLIVPGKELPIKYILIRCISCLGMSDEAMEYISRGLMELHLLQQINLDFTL